MKRIAITLIALFISFFARPQTIIQMVEDAGVYKVPCEINGLKVKMVFDTGAASVSISKSLAEMMVDNGYLTRDDFIGNSKAVTADGRIVDNTKINLRSLVIGDIQLSNVEAVVVGAQIAPLLLGQSAIQRLGTISIKGNKLYITNIAKSASTTNLYEKWDAASFSYSNYTYGFGWVLPRDFTWKREQGLEKHTPFRASGGPFIVFVNAQISDVKQDLWTILPNYCAITEEGDELMEKQTGQIVYERTWEKFVLFGQHALKTTFKEYFQDSRYDEAVETYAEEYYLIRNGYLLIIAIKVNKDIYDKYDCTSYFKSIIQGFTITTKH